MKTIVTIILLVACVGLVVALVLFKSHETLRQNDTATTLLDLSNRLTAANEQIAGLNDVNVVLTNDRATTRETATTLSNQLSDAQSNISRAQQETLRAQQQVTNLNQRIAGLEAQNKKLEQDAAGLTN